MGHVLADLQSQVDALWARAGCGPAVRLLSEAARQDAYWYVEISGDRFRFLHWERGRAEPLTGWLALAEAVHWVLAGMAETGAQAEELRTRGQGGYSRWNWMAPAIALMRRISPGHGAALARTYAEVLTRHPLSEEEQHAARYPLDD